MIRIIRPQAPPALARNELRWLDRLAAARTDEDRKKARSKYGHQQVRRALETTFHGKCAYCESKIKHVSFAHIEHFRPQSVFPNLTFSWSNLLLACEVCNSEAYKGARFPDASEDGPYVNPCEDDPDDHFQFLFDARTQVASVYGITPRGRTTERDLGLNRSDLRVHRSGYVRMLFCISRFAATDAGARELLQEARSPTSEYSAFAVHCT